MKKQLQLLSILFLINLFYSCAVHQPQYSKPNAAWETQQLPTKSIEHQVFLIGDLGAGSSDKASNTLQALVKKSKATNQKNSIIFLGNTFSDNGLPLKSDSKSKLAEQQLKAQLDLVKDTDSELFFLPGNNEWNAIDGVLGVQRQEDFIQDYLDKGDTFIPDNGCSGPEVEELSSTTVLIAIDSQWYLENWNNKEGVNEGCEHRTRDLFLRKLMDKIKDFRHKNIILAMHHPLNSNGAYGGRYSAKTHLLPLPVVGSAAAFLNNSIANPQELRHPNYQALKLTLIDIAEKFTNVIFVAGHEQSLQYFEEEDQFFIVSGAAAGQTPTTLSDFAGFVAGVQGFGQLTIYEDGEVWIEFWSTSDKKGNLLKDSQLIFRKKVRSPLPSMGELIPSEFKEYNRIKQQDSIKLAVLKGEDIKIFNQTFWGELYTQQYLTEFKMPVLDLEREKGGLVAIGRGGGNQTNSIRLKNKDGKIYQLRTIKKVTERFPGIVRKTFANDLAKQQLTAGNPFSALTVGTMASSINVFHTNPKIVYVPKQPNLGIFNDLGGEVYLLEERGGGDWSDLESFGYPDKIENMGNIIEGKLKNGKTLIDQPQVLRSRLFDMILGDWDRHSDQWRWAGFKQENGKTLYKPIPRDRDQAYAKFDGIANTLASYTVPFTRAADNYDGEISKKETTWLNYQARFFDRLFINEITLTDWEREATFIQENLSDEVIRKAIRKLPPFAFDQEGEDLIKWTKMRRDDLLNTARRYYQLLNREVTVLGTHKDNSFIVSRLNDKEIKVSVFEKGKSNRPDELIYERTFETAVTKSLNLYGLDGNDHFEVKGMVGNSALVRLIGGNGIDNYNDESTVNGWTKKTKVFDAKSEESVLNLGKEAKDKRSSRTELNALNYRNFEYNYAIPLPMIGSNPDDGLFFSLNTNWNTFSFKRTQIHKITGRYAIGSKSFSFGYEADYFNAFNHWDAYLKAVAEVPRFVLNFHGFGNETTRNIDLQGRDFYRVRRTLLGIYPAVKRRTDAGLTFSIGPALESVKIEENVNHITNSDDLGILPDVFETQYFSGSNIDFNFFNTDHPVLPSQGLGFTAGAMWRSNLNDFDRQLLQLESQFQFYLRLGRNDRLVLANQLSAKHLIGDFDFFQSVNLGGTNSLRGFAEQRFSGRTTFYHNIDLRIKLFDSEGSVLPVSIGFTPGFDYGRVWVDDDTSDKWHTSYGGTVWLAPLDYIALSIGMYKSEEQSRLIIGAGVQF